VPSNNSSSFSKYENSTYGIKFQYPSDWTAESGNSSPDDEIFSIVGLSPPISTDPNANTFLDIGYDSSVQANDFNVDEYVRGVIETLQTDDTISDFKVESAKTNATLANKPAYSLVTTNTADGTAMKSLEVGTLVGDKLYYILFSTEESKYNSFLPDIQKMIDSFELVSEKGASLNENDKTTVANTTKSQSENDKTTDGNNTESVNPTPDANSNTSFESYENSKYGIKVQYPSGWMPQNEESNSGDDTFQLMINAPITSNGLSYVVIGNDPSIEGENISLEKYVDDTVKGIKEEGIFNIDSAKTDAMLAGRPAYSIALTNTADETDRKSLEVGTLVGNKLYRILFDAEREDYDTLLPDVQKMIESFEITGIENGVNKQNENSVNSPVTFSNDENVTTDSIENTKESVTPDSSELASEKFTTMMSGDEEVPQVDTDASGMATFIPLEGLVKYALNITGLSEATQAHIHLADKGENGYVVADLLEGADQKQTENGIMIIGNITDMNLVGPLGGMTTAELIHLMKGGGLDFMAGQEAGEFKHLYVNLHTEDHPDGEIRGQIS
jgi:hypothetical protein